MSALAGDLVLRGADATSLTLAALYHPSDAMLGAGLVLVLLGGLVALGLVVAALALLVFGIVARAPRHGLIASAVAFVVSLLAIALSFVFWRVVLSGRSTTGEPVDRWGSDFPLTLVVLVEGLALLASLVGIGRQLLRARGGGVIAR